MLAVIENKWNIKYIQILPAQWEGDDDDGDELFLWYGLPTKGVQPYFQPAPLPEILTIANLRQAASRIILLTENIGEGLR